MVLVYTQVTEKGLMASLQLVSVLLCIIFVHLTNGAVGDVYSIGIGRYDITGPAVEIRMVTILLINLKDSRINTVYSRFALRRAVSIAIAV